MENIYINDLKIENTHESANSVNIEGYACHFNRVNLNSEIVDENSFVKFFNLYNTKKLIPIVNYNHDSNQIIGGIDEIISDSTGLYMSAHLNRGVKINDEMIIPNILAGTLNSLSTEGFIEDGYNGIEERADSYYVKNFILTAVAVVANPADWDAKFTLQNFINEYQQQKLQEVLNNLNETEINKIKWYFL